MSGIIPRGVAVRNLEPYLGKELSDYATQYGITIKGNKGWKGHVLERLAGLTTNNDQAPNGLGFELKSVVFVERKGLLVPKETMAITMINPENVVQTDFLKSHLWEKVKSLLLCQVSWDGVHSDKSRFLGMACMEMNTDGSLIEEVQKDYELVQEKLRVGGLTSLSGKDGKWIQPRTKGPGGINKRTGQPNKKTRAFYARKNFITRLLHSGSV